MADYRIFLVNSKMHELESMLIKSNIVGSTGAISNATKSIAKTRADIVIIDSYSGNSMDTQTISDIVKNSDVPVIVHSSQSKIRYGRECIEAGAVAYVQRGNIDELLKVADKTVETQIEYKQNWGKKQIENKEYLEKLMGELSGREQEVFRLLATKYNSRKVATKLEISKKTVDDHITHIERKLESYMEKLGVNNPNGLVAIAAKALRGDEEIDWSKYKLSDKPMGVFRLIGSGISCSEIADKLGITIQTGGNHVREIKNMLHTEDLREVYALASIFVYQEGRKPKAENIPKLDETELQIYNELAAGKTNKYLANQLSISTNKVERYNRNIIEKFKLSDIKVSNVQELIVYASRDLNGDIKMDWNNWNLTPAELRVFKLMGQAETCKGIAKKLNIEITTVDTHIRNIKKETGLKELRELYANAALCVPKPNADAPLEPEQAIVM